MAPEDAKRGVSGAGRNRRLGTSLALVVCASLLAFVAAAVAAVGPAEEHKAVYSWPPTVPPAAESGAGWYAPLPLLSRVPESLRVDLPCGMSPLRSDGSTTVFATASRPSTSAGLQVTLEGNTLRIAAGTQELASVDWPAACPLRLEVEDGALRLEGRKVPLGLDTLEHMPIVTGFFTGLDLTGSESLRASLTTRVYSTSQTATQTLAVVLALGFALIALLLVSVRDVGSLPPLALGSRIRGAWEARHWSDAVVVGVLMCWWIVAPALYDDGWIRAQQRSLADLGTVSFYYDHWGARLPLGHVVESFRHWLTGPTHELVFLRIPALLAALASWFLCRWCLGRGVHAPRHVVRWVLAAAFLVSATAWIMTLRPEAFVSLLAVVCLALAISFQARPQVATLGGAALVCVLAATAHPVGIVASAPLLAAAPSVVRWLRSGGRERLVSFAVVALCAASVGLVLVTAGADLASRMVDVRQAQESGLHHQPPWREFVRYQRFDIDGGASAVRRLSLALLFLSVLGLLTRARSARTDVALLPARSVAVGLVLLAFVPSKWPWHFGALAAVGAVAVATELARLLREPVDQRGAHVRSVVAVVLVLGVGLWAWLVRGSGLGPLDLQVREWDDGFSVYPWLVVLPGLALGALVLRRRQSRPRATSPFVTVAGWSLVAVSFAAVAVTIGLLLADSAETSWSGARQNLQALAGRDRCGVADVLDADPGVSRLLATTGVKTLVVAAVAPAFPCTSFPDIRGGVIETPRFVVLQYDAWPLDKRDSGFAALVDLYELKLVGRGPRAIWVYAVQEDRTGFARVDALRRMAD